MRIAFSLNKGETERIKALLLTQKESNATAKKLFLEWLDNRVPVWYTLDTAKRGGNNNDKINSSADNGSQEQPPDY